MPFVNRKLHRRPAAPRISLALEALEDRTLLSTPGTLDPSFGSGGVVTALLSTSLPTERLNAIAIQSDGKILAAGGVSFGGNTPELALARFNTDGTLDQGFGTNGVTLTSFNAANDTVARGVALDGDKIIVAGYVTSGGVSQVALARYDSTGHLDATFGSGGLVTAALDANSYATGVAVDASHDIIVAGGAGAAFSASSDVVLARFTSGGSLDNSFGNNGVVETSLGPADAAAQGLALDGLGRIVVVGHSSTSGGNFHFAVLRYTSGGALDTSFDHTGMILDNFAGEYIGFPGDDARAVAIDLQNRVVAVGTFEDQSFRTDVALARYNADGTPDTSFNGTGKASFNLGGYDAANAVALQANGKVVLAGSDGQPGGSYFLTARYNADGTPDTGFGNNGSTLVKLSSDGNDVAHAVAIQADGKILSAGTEAEGNTASDFAIMRLFGDPVSSSNVLVNDPTADLTAQDTQSETTLLAFNGHVVVGFNDSGSFINGQNKFTGFAYSSDGGATFTDGGTLPTNPNGDAGDPVLARDDSTGRIYLATLQFSGSGIDVFHSDDNGVTWSAPVQGAPGKSGFQDKEWMAVDNFAGTGQGNIYLLERDFGGGDGIYFYRSTDHGATFGQSGGTLITSGDQGGYVSVGPDHTVYVFWWHATFAGESLQMRKSTDGGLTFGTAVTVANLSTLGVNGDLGLTVSKTDGSAIRSNAFPQAVVLSGGRIFVTYNDVGVAANDKADVFLVESTDNGASWGSPVKLNTDSTTTDQWQPAIAATPDGKHLGVFWYSRELDPSGDGLIDRWGVTGSVNGNVVAFGPTFRVTDTSFPAVVNQDSVVEPTYMGDYDQAVADNSAFYLTWGDNRLSDSFHAHQPDVRFAKIAISAATHFEIDAPTAVTAGQPFSVTVTALDENDQVVTDYAGTVHFTSSDPKATLPTDSQDYTFTAGDGGVHTFVLGTTLFTAGPQSVVVTDIGSLASGSAGVLVNAAAATQLLLKAPGTATAGAPFTVTVVAADQYGNADPTYVGTIHFSSTDAGAGRVLPGDYQFTAQDAGQHAFTLGVTLVTAGLQTLDVKDVVVSQFHASAQITVTPSAVAHLGINAPPSATAGAAFSITVSALDQFNNVVATYGGAVHFSTSDFPVAVPADYVFTASDQGIHTFTSSVFLFHSGQQFVFAQDKALAGVNGSAAVTVTAASASRYSLTLPSVMAAGVPGTATLTVRDAFGNIATGYTGTVQFTAGGAMALPSNYTFTGADQGVHTFVNGVTLGQLGQVTVTAFDTVVGYFLNGQATVTVVPGPAARFLVVPTSSAVVGATSSVIVTALDPAGNTAIGYLGTVHFTSTDARAILPADYTFIGNDQGVHTFANLVILRTVGVIGVRATDTVSPSITGAGTENVLPRPTPPMVVVGADYGALPEVKLVNPQTSQVVMDFMAYDTRFRGGVRVAMGDLNADGVPDIITSPGPTGGPDVKVFDGRTGALIREWGAYPGGFTGGVFVAAGDINNDGYADIVTGADAGGGPHVEVWSGQTGQLLQSFYAYSSLFSGGVRVAVGDINGDGIPDIITGAGPGGGPHVKVFSGKDRTLLRSFFAYASGFAGGVYVAAGDTNADGKADIITGAGAGGGPHVEVFSGLDNSLLQSYYAYSASFTGGVRVGALDLNGDGHSVVVTGPGTGMGPDVRLYGLNKSLVDDFFAFKADQTNGVFVGGA